jgi:hypothetical protein
MPTATFPSITPVSAAYARRSDVREGQFCKFGEARFLRALVDGGNLRLFAGSHYSDASLNPAAQDDELGLDWWHPPDNIQITLPDGTVSARGLVRDFEGRTDYISDYHVWCLSRGLHNRLLEDFASDCFVVVYNMNEFLRSIKRATQTELPGWTLYFDPVTYVDPYNLPKWETPVMPYCKHHKYFYQHQWRLVIHPPSMRTPKLPPVDLKLDISPGSFRTDLCLIGVALKAASMNLC